MKQDNDPPQKVSKFNYYLPVALLAIFGFFLPPVMLKSWESHVIVISIIFTIGFGGGFWLFRILRKHIGFFTAGAALGLVLMVALATLFAVQPVCPGSLTGDRCSNGEIASWALTGLLAVGTFIMALAIPSWFYKTFKSLTKTSFAVVSRGFRKFRR